MEEQRIEDLQDDLRRGQKMRRMTETDGWRDLLLPHLVGVKSAAVKSWLTTDDVNEMARSRQAYRTLDAVQSFIENTVKLGDAARDALKPQEARG